MTPQTVAARTSPLSHAPSIAACNLFSDCKREQEREIETETQSPDLHLACGGSIRGESAGLHNGGDGTARLRRRTTEA